MTRIHKQVIKQQKIILVRYEWYQTQRFKRDSNK